MKDVKKLLKEQSKHILPDESVKENIRRELGFSDGEQTAAYAHGETGGIGKRGLISIIAVGLALVLCLCILLPILLNRSPANPGLIGGGTLDSIDTADEFYAYGAASVGSLLASAQTASQGAADAAVPKSARAGIRTLSVQTRAGGLTDEERQVADTVNGYLGLAEGLLSDEAIEYTAEEILTDSETDGDETEAEYAISGILLVDGEQYPVRGEKETESEEGESELSLTFTAYRPSDASRELPYLRMEQESEEEAGEESEKFFLYTLYDENGREAETTSVEYEQEDGETELKITVRRGGETDELLLWRENGRGNVLTARAKIGGKEYSFTVTIEEGNYRYEFSDGNSGGGDRPGHGDDDDDDDDD